MTPEDLEKFAETVEWGEQAMSIVTMLRSGAQSIRERDELIAKLAIALVYRAPDEITVGELFVGFTSAERAMVRRNVNTMANTKADS